jgi:hypothetical protein
MALGFGLLSFLMALLGLCMLLCFFFSFVGCLFSVVHSLVVFSCLNFGKGVCMCDMGNPYVVGVSIIWVVAFSDVLW